MLIDRLISRHLHYLAYDICMNRGLKSATEKVLVHWGCAKVWQALGGSQSSRSGLRAPCASRARRPMGTVILRRLWRAVLVIIVEQGQWYPL